MNKSNYMFTIECPVYLLDKNKGKKTKVEALENRVNHVTDVIKTDLCNEELNIDISDPISEEAYCDNKFKPAKKQIVKATFEKDCTFKEAVTLAYDFYYGHASLNPTGNLFSVHSWDDDATTILYAKIEVNNGEISFAPKVNNEHEVELLRSDKAKDLSENEVRDCFVKYFSEFKNDEDKVSQSLIYTRELWHGGGTIKKEVCNKIKRDSFNEKIWPDFIKE